MSIDPELVRRKASLILDDLRRLEPHAARAVDEYVSDELAQLAVERLMERIIGRMIDLNYHLAVGRGGQPPRDYWSSFTGLAALGVTDRDTAQQWAAAAGLRNRLAHEYDGIDARRVHAAARTALTDVPAYLRAVEAFLDG